MPDLLSSNLFAQLNFNYMMPEVVMTIGLLVVLILTILSNKKTVSDNETIMYAAQIFILASLCMLLWNFNQFAQSSGGFTALPQVQYSMFNSLTVDIFSYFIRSALLIGASLTVFLAHHFLLKTTRVVGDFYLLLMGATLGGMFLSMTNDLILFFVALETLSITSYVLVGYLRKTVRSAEASLKYLIYGGTASAIFLFGLSIIYGLVGSTNFQDIAQALTQFHGLNHPTLSLMVLMVVSALAFKLSLAPFHMWTPDVYEGAPTPVSAFLSIVSKIASLAIAIRVLMVLFAGFSEWTTLLIVLSVLSMTVGNFLAIKQTSFKRLLAYSTIAHAGYMMLGLVVASVDGISGTLYYAFTYIFMNMGAFAGVIYFQSLSQTDTISAFGGLVHKRIGLTLGLTICLLSLAGIPITAGFFAKFFLFQSVVTSGTGYLWLIIVALLNSTISLYYYLRPVYFMVAKEPSGTVNAIPDQAPVPWTLTTAMAFCVFLTLLLGIFPSWVYTIGRLSAQQILSEQPMVLGQAAQAADYHPQAK